jgi:hypothetical protein
VTVAVYVDPEFRCGRRPGWKWPTSSHMYADSPEELHAFALKIGLRRTWASDYTQPGSLVLHYDLNATRRAAALAGGAVETDRRHILQFKRSLQARKDELDAASRRG